MANTPRNRKGQFTTNNGTWFKNAAKSLGYAGIDLLKETMPALTETIDINKEFVTDIVKTMRQNKAKDRRFNIKSQLTGKALDNWIDSEEYVRNALTDLKTGQFYNKTRMQASADDWGLDGFDMDDMSFDVSDDLDDSDIDLDDESVKVVAPNVTVNTNINSDNPMVRAVQQHSKLLADAESVSAKREITIAETQMKLDKDLANVLYGGIQTVNTNLATMIEFNNEHTSGYIGASLKYYEENIRYMAEISDTLKKISGAVERNDNNTDDIHSMDQIFESSGGFNLSGYMKVVKKQLRNAIDEDMLMGSVLAMLESDGIKALAQSPLTFIPQMILNKMVPELLTTTFKSFDKSFKSFVPALLNKVGSWADDEATDLMSAFKGFVGSVLGIKNVGKTEVDPAVYERGVVPFDGITRKSIVEVIPGYLSKILSALTGKEELIFNSDTGRFIKKSDLNDEYNSQVRRAATSSFEATSELKSRVRTFGLSNDQSKQVENDIDTLLIELAKRKKSFNPYKLDGRDDLNEILGGKVSDPNTIEIIRSLILSLDRAQIEDLAGAGHINARRNLTKLLEGYEKTGNMVGMAQVNGLYDKEADYRYDNPLIQTSNIYTGNSSDSRTVGSIFTPSDKYGKTSLNYLRDIYRTLLEGIGVWYVSPVNDRLKAFGISEAEADRTILRSQSNNPIVGLTDEQIKYNAEHGIMNFQDIFNVRGSTEEQVEMIRSYVEKRDGNLTIEQKQPSHFTKLLRFIFGTKEDKQKAAEDVLGSWQTALKNAFIRVDEAMYKIVFGENSIGYEGERKAGLLSSMRSDFKVWLFGEKDSEGKSIGGIFNKFNTFLTDKIFNPIKDAFIGQDGIITRFKQSEFYKSIVNSIRKSTTNLLGEMDSTGRRSGGKLSSWVNRTSNFIKGTSLSDIRYNATTGYYVNSVTNEAITDQRHIDQLDQYRKDFKWDENVASGKRVDDGVIGNIKNIGRGFRDSLREWLFGTDPSKTKDDAKGLLSDVTDYFKQGMQGFTDLIFGQKFNKNTGKVESEIHVDELIGKIKERAPKAIASGIVGGGLGLLAGAGGFGILGSLFLGPMSGVVIGTATGFLSQSDKFKNWLFGEKDDDGKRVGGLISRETQEFFKKHKGAIIGGSALGALKGLTGFGILPSFILGGPITGALFGLGASIITRSEMFQNLLFGEKDDDGKRAGGIIGKITGSLDDSSIKKKLGFGAAGLTLGAIGGTALSSFGILGGIAFGPLSGAILGAGVGIAMAADKWKDAIFGKFDKDGKKTSQGILSKMMTAVSVEVLQPAKVQIAEWRYNVQDWFAEHIAEPFIDSVEPIKEELKRFKDNIVDFGKRILDKLHITDIFISIGDGIKTGFTRIGKFTATVAKKGIEGIGKITGAVLSAPGKLVQMIVNKILLPKHMREGIKAVRDKILDNIKDSKFVQSVNTHIIEPVKGTILEVRDFAKDAITKTFSWIWNGLKKVGSGLISSLTAPFKGFAAIGHGLTSLFNRGTVSGPRDTERFSEIMNAGRGERGFVQSVGDLISLANPFSSLRRAAKFSEYGAHYQDARESRRDQRKAERDAKREEHKQRIQLMRENLNFTRDEARALGYDIPNDDQRGILTNFNKLVDKEYIKKYGKDYKSLSGMDKDTFRETKAINKTVFSINDKFSSFLDLFRGFLNDGIKIKGDGASDSDMSDGGISVDIPETTPVLTSTGATPEITDSDTDDDGADGTTKIGSYAHSMMERKTEEERLKQQGIFHKIANLLEIGNKDRKEHSSVWSSIFSKKGLITGGLLLLLPLAYNFFKNGFNWPAIGENVTTTIREFFGLEDTNGTNTDASGNIQTNNDAIESATVGAIKLGSKVVHGVAKSNLKVSNGISVAKGVINTTKTKAKDIYNKLTKKTTASVADDVAKAGASVVDDVLEAGTKAAIKSGADDAAKAATKSTVISKFIGLLDDAVGKLTQWLGKKFPNFAANSIVKSVLGALDNVLKGSSKLLSFVDDILKGLNKIAASNTTMYILDAGFVAYGAITGASKTETANVFGVSQDDVTPQMQTASSILKSILSFSWFFVISLASDISVAIGGPNIVRLLAQALYSLVVGGDTDKIQSLSDSQNSFNADYEQYVGVQEYLKGNATITVGDNGEKTFSVVDPSTVESKDSYNDRVNKTIGSKIGAGIKSGWTSVKTFFAGQKGDADAYNDAKSKLDQLNSLVEQGLISENDPAYITTKESLEKKLNASATKQSGIRKIGNKLYDATEGIRTKIGEIANVASDIISPYANIAKELLTYATDVVKVHLKLAFDKDTDTDNLQIDDNDPLKGIKKSLYIGLKVLTFPTYMSLKAATLAWDNVIKPAGQAIIDLGRGFIQDSMSMSTSIFSGNDIFTKQYWTAPESDDGTTSGLRKAGFYAQRFMSLPVGLNMSIATRAWNDVIKPAGQAVIDLGRGFIEDSKSMATSIFKGDDIFTKQYWTAPESDDGTTSGLRKAGFYAQRLISLPVGLNMSVASHAWNDVIKPVGGAIIDLGRGFIEDSKSMATSIFKGDDIFTKQYWTAPESDNGPVSGLRKAGFYAQRLISLPVGLNMSVASHAWNDVIKPVGQAVIDLGRGFIEDSLSVGSSIANGNNIFTKQYWTPPESDSGPVSGLRKVGFYAQRILSAPAGLTMSVGKYAADNISSLTDGLFNVGSFINTVFNFKDVESGSYLTFKDSSKSPLVYNLKRAIFYTSRTILAPMYLYQKALGTIGEKIKEKFSGLGQWFVDLFDLDTYFKDHTNSGGSIGGGIGGPITSNYFRNYPDQNLDNDDGVGGSAETAMLAEYKVNSPYGKVRTIAGKTKRHGGIDLDKGNNKPVYSFTDGTVHKVIRGYKADSGKAGSTDGGGFGNHVVVKDKSGHYNYYAHLNGVNVTKGQTISRGEKVGIQGHTGSSTGSHLHYEVRKSDNATSINPKTHLQNYTSASTTNNKTSNSNSKTSSLQQALVDKMLSILGKIKYSTTAAQDPDKGTASCASTVAWAYNKVLGFRPGDTVGKSSYARSREQCKDDHFTTIYTNTGNNPLDLSILQPGDIVYQHWGRTSHKDGEMKHTEMYGGKHNGKHSNLSHGGSPHMGPTWKTYDSYRKKHTMLVRRYNGFMGADGVNGNILGNISDATSSSTSSGILGNVTNALTSQLTNMMSPISEVTSKITNDFNSLLGSGTSSVENVTSDTATNNSNITYDSATGSMSEKNIWDYLKTKGFNNRAIAGIMGNLYAESALKSNNLQQSYNNKFGLSDEEYTKRVDSGSYGDNKFINDSAGYGLAQWTYWSLKKGLIEAARRANKSVADPNLQLDVLYNQLKDNGLVKQLNNSSSVKEASNIMLTKYERPADQGTAVQNKRAGFSQDYYNKYAGVGGGIGGGIDDIDEPNTPSMGIVYQNRNTTMPTSNTVTSNNIKSILQNANNSNMSSAVIEYLKKIADGIMSIVSNTDTANVKLEEIKKIESESVKSNNQQNPSVVAVNAPNNTSTSPMYEIANNRRNNIKNKGYQTAKAIASGI